MHLEIPSQFRHIPEAIKLRELDAEFAKVCELEVAAVNSKLWETDLPSFIELETKSKELHLALKEAVAAFDNATGEPKPIELPCALLSAINDQFPDAVRFAVKAKLAKTLAYLQRQQVSDPRVAQCILKLAEGNADRVIQYADQACVDYRDIILSAAEIER